MSDQDVIDGLNDPNPYGQTPLINNNPAIPNPGYFEHVDYVIGKAENFNALNSPLHTTGGVNTLIGMP